MITIRKSNARGTTEIPWLESKHTFSFGEYHDPNHMGFRTLRVINEDIVAPGQGFGMHPHRNMEIITFVLSGALEHQDSLGHKSVIRPGIIQKMTAGRGIIHSEINPSQTEPVHLLQIWITPETTGLAPSYEEAEFRFENGSARLAAPEGQGGAVKINQNAKISAIGVSPNQEQIIKLDPTRYAWVQITKGKAMLNDIKAEAGDGFAIKNEKQFVLSSKEGVELLLFDLA